VLKADNLPPSCAVVTESRNLNFLEPSGPLRACNGTALPLTFTTVHTDSAISILIYQVCMAVLFSLAHASALEVRCLLQSVGELILLLVGGGHYNYL